MKFSSLLILLLFYCNALRATTIVVYITPEFVIMAADSKVIFTDIKTNRDSAGLVSKIYQRGNVFFALSGVAYNTRQHFDIAKTVNACLKENLDLDKAIGQIKTAIKKILLPYLVYMKSRNTQLYQKNLAASDYITSVALICIKAGRPYAHLIGFKVKDGSAIDISTEEVSFAKGSKKDAVYYLGQKEAINAFMDTVTKVRGAPELFAENLVKLQIAKTPTLVGLPIDILRLTPVETVWIRRKTGTPVRLK